MARIDRSSDGPMPYGPPDRSGEPRQQELPPPEPGPPPQVLPPPPPSPPTGVTGPIAPWAPPPGAFSTSVPGAAALVYGRTLDRVVAWWVDGIVVAVPTVVLALILGGVAVPTGLRLGGASLVASIIAVGINLLYFVTFWTGSARATPGMRLMKLQIGDAKTGVVPTVQQGIVRWLAIGGAFQLAQIIPDLAALAVLFALVWAFALLASTATSPTRQGLHDRIADTVLVQPAGARTPAVTCLVLMVGLFVVWVLGIVALLFLGAQVSGILSGVGTSI